MSSILKPQKRHIADILEIWKELTELHREKGPWYPLKQNKTEEFNAYLTDLLSSSNANVLISQDDKEITGFGIASFSTPPPLGIS